MDLQLKDQVVVITGASGGIGGAICEAFLEEGARVVALYRGESSKLDPLRERIHERSLDLTRFAAVLADLSSQASTDAALERIVTDFGRVDVVVNNAGHAFEMPFIGTPEADWDAAFEANLHTAARLMRAAFRPMLHAKRGNIVNVSSVVGGAQGRGVSAYASAKSALNRLTEITALEMGRKGIRVNAVAPGAIETKMSSALMRRAGDVVLERTPLKRTGTPEEVARAVLFLASEASAAYVTGHVLYVDGGVHL